MRSSFVTGISFGLTSGVITTLGLLIGLSAGTHSRLAVIGGVLTIAIADAFSDALGMHLAEESKNHHEMRHIWEATIATWFAKFFIAASFVIPVLTMQLNHAVTTSLVWGGLLILILSIFISRARRESLWMGVAEHLGIAIVVIIIAQFVGQWINSTFR